MPDKQTQLITYLDSIIEQINQIKTNPEKEIESQYFNLSCIAYRMEIYSIGGFFRRRRGKQDSDDDE